MSGTYISKIPVLVVALVIGIVLVTSAVVPLASDYSEAKTFKNEGYYTMDKVAADADFVLTFNYGSSIIDVDGKTMDMSTAGFTAGKAYTIMGADNFVLRMAWGNNPYLQYFGDQSVSPNFITAVTAGSKITVTVSDGSVVFASTDASYPNSATLTLSENTYCINPEGKGDYTMKKADGIAYIVEDTDIIILDGISNLAANDVGIYAEGTIDTNLEASTFRGTGTYDVTFGDFVYTTSDVSGYIDLVKLEKVDFTATQNSTDYDVSYSYFIVPSEVSADPDNPAAYKNLVKVVPLMAFIMLVVAAAGMVYLKNKD